MTQGNAVEVIKAAYKRSDERMGRTGGKIIALKDYLSPYNLFRIQSAERELSGLFYALKIDSLDDKLILDVGCGGGWQLRKFVLYGADPQKLYGIDLLEDRIDVAKRLSPNINWQCGNAEALPYPDGHFDIVMQATAFTSVKSFEMKQGMSKEMLRVLKPHGLIFWYDYFFSNPSNPDVQGVRKGEIERLFSGCSVSLRRTTLAPPISRRIAPRSVILAYLLEKVPFLCTHYLGVIRKS